MARRRRSSAALVAAEGGLYEGEWRDAGGHSAGRALVGLPPKCALGLAVSCECPAAMWLLRSGAHPAG